MLAARRGRRLLRLWGGAAADLAAVAREWRRRVEQPQKETRYPQSSQQITQSLVAEAFGLVAEACELVAGPGACVQLAEAGGVAEAELVAEAWWPEPAVAEAWWPEPVVAEAWWPEPVVAEAW